MSLEIRKTPAELMWYLKNGKTALTGKCFENCIIAVLGWNEKMRPYYVLGFLTPPSSDTVVHAWIEIQDPAGAYYLDPTLQDESVLWSKRRSEFVYDKRHVLSKAAVLDWFRKQYPDRTFSDIGVPEGIIRLPIMNGAGQIE